MIVYVGKRSGFCFGVKRAIDTALSLKGENNFVLGEIIHNDKVNEDLQKRGIVRVDSLYDKRLHRGDTVLIRTHGEPESTFKTAEKLGLNLVDCTCPFVEEIHKKVREYHDRGYKIVIVGDKNHPEVKGINGWCDNNAIIIDSEADATKIDADKVCVVVQTTFEEKKFDKIVNFFASKGLKTVDIFKTICYTTTERQKETEIIAKRSDAVLVLGGANSNNTAKLFEIASKYCKNVFRLCEPDSFDYLKLKNFYKVGIVLGASTPIEQFQKVVQNMEKVTEEIVKTEVSANEEVAEVKEETVAPENAVAEEVKEEVVADAKAEEVKEEVSENKPLEKKDEMKAAFDNIRTRDFKVGQVITAKISSAKDDGLTISIKNTKKDFEIPKDELLGEYDKDAYKDKIGEEIRVMVIGKNPAKFSEKAMERVLKEEAEIAEIKEGKIFEAEITATNKGGLTGKYLSYEVFVPASQIRMGFVKDLEKYVGKTLRLKAEKVESRGARRQIVGSQRVILEAEKAERDAIRAEKKKEFFDNVGIGDVVLGTPVRFTDFGAFVDVNGFDCLAHISDLSWTGCKNCAEVLEIGKQYEFKVLKIDEATERVSIGYKQLQPKPWDTVLERYAVGDVIKGKVVRIVSFGAFVEVEKGIDALVHVSQISNKWLENPVTALQVGQEIEAKIINIIPEKEKMNLSIKALLPEEEIHETETEEKKGKGRAKKAEEPQEEELREWKDEGGSAGVSIAEMLENNENK